MIFYSFEEVGVVQGKKNCLLHCKKFGMIPWHRNYKELDCFEFVMYLSECKLH